MLIMKEGSGQEKAPDFEELVKTLNPAQIAFLATVLRHAAENDYGVLEEFYMWVANTYMDYPDSVRKDAAAEGSERFFTVKAWERYQKEMEEARRAGKKAEDAGIWMPPNGGRK